MILPYLTVVIAARNDEYVKGTQQRFQVCVSSLLEQAERYKLPLELVLVDWNTPPGMQPLRETLTWPSKLQFCSIRIIEVPPDVVDKQFGLSRKWPFLVHAARNVGIRRARGKFVLPTATDILFSDALVQFLASKQLDSERMYRVERWDVRGNVANIAPHCRRLAYCEENVVQVYGRAGSRVAEGYPRLFTNASGDFAMLSRDLWFKVHGFPEERELIGVHFDSILCYMAYAAGAREEVLQDSMRIYHMDHDSVWKPKQSTVEQLCWRWTFPRQLAPRLASLARRISPPKSEMTAKGVPYIDMTTPQGIRTYDSLIHDIVNGARSFAWNGDDWGLASYSLPESVIAAASGQA